MRLSVEDCQRRLASARVARLATTGADQQPHLVPVTFALNDDRLVIGIDQKPKTTTQLRRLRNIAENPKVALLCDHYDEDWSQLWWVRVDGTATVVDAGAYRDAAMEMLVARYQQYADGPPRGPVIVVAIHAWSGWAYAG